MSLCTLKFVQVFNDIFGFHLFKVHDERVLSVVALHASNRLVTELSTLTISCRRHLKAFLFRVTDN